MTKAKDIDLTVVMARIKAENARIEKEYMNHIAALKSSVFTAIYFTKIDSIEFHYVKYPYKYDITWRKFASTIHETVKEIKQQPTVKIRAISLQNTCIVQIIIEDTNVVQEPMMEVVDYEIVEKEEEEASK